MKDIETKKALRELRKLCRRRGIELTVGGGRGSHITLVFFDPDTQKSIKLVVGGHGSISPGVQRDIIQYADEAQKWSGVSNLAGAVLRILVDVFGG